MNSDRRLAVFRPGAIPPVVRALLIANVAIFVLVELAAMAGSNLGGTLILWFALWPVGSAELAGAADAVSFWPWQLVTYGFLHANFVHLFFNLFAVWMLGSALERLWGSYHFLIFYFVCVIGAGLVQLYVNGGALTVADLVPTVGASGGVFGILLAYGMMFPNSILMLLFPPIPLKAKYFVMVYGLVELTLGVSAPDSPVAHFAHLGGMAFGFVLIQYWRGRLPLKPRWILNM